jgi:hypothetical protein
MPAIRAGCPNAPRLRMEVRATENTRWRARSRRARARIWSMSSSAYSSWDESVTAAGMNPGHASMWLFKVSSSGKRAWAGRSRALWAEAASASLASGFSHHGRNLAEDRTDRVGDPRHDGSSGNRHKARHQSVFNQVLSAVICPFPQPQNRTGQRSHSDKSSVSEYGASRHTKH